MASFFEKLWESIFTPGPTPTLLIATNASFAVLQVLLWGLLYVTYSIHFLMLALLSGGLWWAINWFAAEILEAQRAEEEAKRLREVKKQKDQGKGKGAASDGETMDTGDDTEVDTEVEAKRKPKLRHNPPRAARPETQSTVFVEKPVETTARESTPQASSRTGVSATGRLAPTDEALKKRKSLGESTGELSTDSEWEKLSEDSGEK